MQHIRSIRTGLSVPVTPRIADAVFTDPQIHSPVFLSYVYTFHQSFHCLIDSNKNFMHTFISINVIQKYKAYLLHDLWQKVFSQISDDY